MAETCAMRGLALTQPVAVRPMADFEGGYTPGVGSVSWDEDYAEQWRRGWCALGVYCASEPSDAKPDEAQPARDSRLANPNGLYDRERNVLFVRETGADFAATIAHETVHALQFQNHPNLGALHPWHNRDLAAAANTAIEGDAHVVGRTFDAQRSLHLCSIDPRNAAATHRQWWQWQPNVLWAYQGLPHVFGPEQALQRALRSDTDGLDEWLRQPPVSTLAVLHPPSAGDVDFIRLPNDILDPELTERGCSPALANTAGALGIWGLLAQHGDTGGDEFPELLRQWRGDRFVHVACPGDDNDELAWLTRWNTRQAGHEFAVRFRGIAASAAAGGGVLGAAAEAFVRRRNVVVATPGLRHAVAAIVRSHVETFARYADWIESGCFPQRSCDAETLAAVAEPRDHVCATNAATAPRLRNWLGRVRRARSAAAIAPAEASALADDVAALATFCARNGRRNADFATACRAVYGGIRFQLQLREDAHWRLLPHCATADEMRDWVQATYYADAALQPAGASAFAGLHGVPLAAQALAENGGPGLAALATHAPVSTRQILWPGSGAVDFIRLSPATLREAGCETTASNVLGALGIWDLLLEHGDLHADAPPSWLEAWRGDRQAYLRCAEGEGWAWASRWRDAEAAALLAATYNALPSRATDETALGGNAQAAGRDVWVMPPALAPLTPTLVSGLEARPFNDLHEWRAAGCFPEPACE